MSLPTVAIYRTKFKNQTKKSYTSINKTLYFKFAPPPQKIYYPIPAGYDIYTAI